MTTRTTVILLLFAILTWGGSAGIAYGVVELTGGGPQGEQGEQGPRGAPGKRGTRGLTGAAGTSPSDVLVPFEPEVSLTVNSGLEFEDIPSRVVVVDITIENEGATEFFHSTTQFRAIDSEGFTHSSEPPVFSTGVPRGYLLPPLFDGVLRAGERIRAQISFRVDPGTQLIELRWRISESSEFTFELPTVKLQRRPG